MIPVLLRRGFRTLFAAQVVALLGTGLLTVALGLLAFDVAGADAGRVMGLAMTIKMVAYVGVAPVVSAVVCRLPRKLLLVATDLVRAGVALCLPFVEQTWHIYALIFVLQAASATFTPAFQALIPSVLPDERDYTRALSLSRLAYDVEALVSPVIAAALLTVVAYGDLFVGTVVGFLGSALLVLGTRLPRLEPPESEPFRRRVTSGARIFAGSAELRGLLGLNLVVATTTAMVIVNTVVVVRTALGRGESDVATLLAAYGAGSMLVALTLPRVLDRVPDRRVMLGAATVLPGALAAATAVLVWVEPAAAWGLLLALWFLTGAATSAVLTPSARLLQRNSTEASRPAVFAGQFALSHACFLVTYPVAGLLGASAGLPVAGVVLVGLGIVGLGVARAAWRPGAFSGGESRMVDQHAFTT